MDLVKIDVSHNAIPSLADDIAGLATVTSFKLAQNALQTLPDGFFELTALTYLDLSQCVAASCLLSCKVTAIYLHYERIHARTTATSSSATSPSTLARS